MTRVINWVVAHGPTLGVLSALALAAVAGGLAASAFGITDQQEPTKTVTVDVATGPTGATGPAGPQGQPGPAGEFTCLTGYSPGILVLVQQGKGPTRVYTCLED
ncbi:MAG TPA: hypothetical protein VKD72_25725 [Gemmataceae bacterium]|nr:hypothetical protein [Gemmataceae bacterium]